MTLKELFINSVKMVEIDRSLCIPTVLYYGPDKMTFIGYSAIDEAKSRNKLNEDFKIDLGEYDPKTTTDMDQKRKFTTATGEKKSAAALTGDFLNELLKYSEQWLEVNDITRGVNVMLAEPLAMQTDVVSHDWLSKYRDNLNRILHGKLLGGKRIENIDFLPEPFAVFQYYRHGYRHPILAEKAKYNILAGC